MTEGRYGPRGGRRIRVAPGAAAGPDASRRDRERLSDDRAAVGILLGEDAVGFDHQGDGFAEVRAGFFEGGAFAPGNSSMKAI